MKKSDAMRDIAKRLERADTTSFYDFYVCKTPLLKGLWILWVAKEKLKIPKLTAEEITSAIRTVMEMSIDEKSITKAFNRAGDKIHTYHENGVTHFEIMKPGKDFLLTQSREGSVKVLYFEPDKRFTSKRILGKDIIPSLKGELKIVDPYVNERTLDVLKEIKGRRVRFLTKLGNLVDKDRNRFLREIGDFRSEYKNVELRSYPYADIHDRYAISSDALVILGCSIKDLGRKESFAVLLHKTTSKNVFEALNEIFDRRWKQSQII